MGFVNSRLHNNFSGAVTMVLAPAEHRLSGVSCQNDVTQMIAVYLPNPRSRNPGPGLPCPTLPGFLRAGLKILRRSTPICAHLLQPINRSIKLNHLVSACDYGTYRWGSSLTFARPPTLCPPRPAVSPLYCHREPILLPHTPSFSYS